jgi:CHASE2 domain-containing sensor protein
MDDLPLTQIRERLELTGTCISEVNELWSTSPHNRLDCRTVVGEDVAGVSIHSAWYSVAIITGLWKTTVQ